MERFFKPLKYWLARQPEGDESWARFLKWFAGGSAALLVVAGFLAYIIDPYGVVPFSLRYKRDIVDLNQRYFYPLVVRQAGFDSFVMGTSTIRLLDPDRLNATFGGRFANFGMNAGTAWEQWKLADLWLRERPAPRTIVVGLDLRWCAADAATPAGKVTERGFPDWLYDENRWNDLLYIFNSRTVEFGVRAIAVKLGLRKARYREDGYEVFTPPEASYDAAKAWSYLWGSKQSEIPAPISPAIMLGEDERKALAFPALDWLADIARRTGGQTSLVFLWTPPHVARLPRPGSREDAIETECKARVEAIARQARALTVDWRFYSPVTTQDSNFWDPLHYRLPIAGRLADSLAEAQAGVAKADDGAWIRRTP